MDIAAMNVKITFQKNNTVTDSYGNHKNEWTDYFTCFATVSGESGEEQSVVGETVENTEISFTVRYCSAVSVITSTGYRIVFNDELYNIYGIDHFSYKKKAVKFKCRKERR